MRSGGLVRYECALNRRVIMSLLNSLSPRALAAPESGIVEVITYARGQEGLIPLWAGEGDLPSPDFINRAASEALLAGETFYTWQRGIPELRDALSRYYARHFSVSLPSDHFYVTGSGMHATNSRYGRPEKSTTKRASDSSSGAYA